ncbi:MAG: ATP-binding cassette domain-containing protein [Burkholderiales bacterium]|nr:ATP-binding cassette domain-containing protein [Burkholderiales bacterium]
MTFLIGTTLAPMPGAAADPAESWFACSDLRACYGANCIVRGAGFRLARGQILALLALLGRDGAGKTATLRAIARRAAPQLQRGEIWLDGHPLHRLPAWRAAWAGISLAADSRQIMAGASVRQTLQPALAQASWGWSLKRIYDRFPLLASRRRDVKLLLLDEPEAGAAPLRPREIERLFETIRSLGLTAVVVERNANAAMQLADRAMVLDLGRPVFEGEARELLRDAALVRLRLAG